MSSTVTFFLNGQPHVLTNPSPNLLLLDYIRSPEVKLAGAKKGCGQGGCGACTVILSSWNEQQSKAEHRSINSCLRPVCSLNGMSVTTVEGTGGAQRLPPKHPQQTLASSRAKAPFGNDTTANIVAAQTKTQGVREKLKARGEELITVFNSGTLDVSDLPDIDPSINPVAYRLAVNNGSQCGYCSTGFVMNMSAFLANNPSPTKKQIELAFDGNICRCTGYRPILTAMKTFAVDWDAEDEKHRMQLLVDDQVKAQHVGDKVRIPFPEAAKQELTPVNIETAEQRWLMPTTLEELLALYQQVAAQDIYLLHGNTAFGVYTEDFRSTWTLVDISQISEIYGIELTESYLRVGAGTTYTEFFNFLSAINPSVGETSALGALRFMAHRTAGTIVRNAATLGGNTMLVLKHMQHGEPFPSDLFTPLVALDAEISFVQLDTAEVISCLAADLVQRCLIDEGYAHKILLLNYLVPLHSNAMVLAQKVALRDINAHSIVNNASIIEVDDSLTITDINLTFGALAPFPWRAKLTEAAMSGQTLTLDAFPKWADILKAEVAETLHHWAQRMAEVEYEGFTDAYRTELALGYLYKAIVTCLVEQNPSTVPQDIRSASDISWGNWKVSDGRQYYQSQDYKAPVSQPYVKLMALYQTSGQVRYTHEMEVPPTTLNAAFVQSHRPLADFSFKHPESGETLSASQLEALLRVQFNHFRHLITVDNVPQGGMNMLGMGGDQPVFASERVSYVGQSIALVVGTEQESIDLLADYVSEHCIHYSKVDWQPIWQTPVLSLDDAIERGSIFPDYPKSAPFVNHIWKIIRNHSRFDWVQPKPSAIDKSISTRKAVIDGIACTVVEATQTVGGQIHFYMETQACVAMPAEGDTIQCYPSSQSPMEMHQTAAAVLGFEHNQVAVKLRQLGGGYGGKTEQAKFVIAPAAVAAKAINKPVRLVMPRANDTSMIGKRHPYYGQYQIAIDDGTINPDDKGLIRGVDLNLYGDGGAFYDCSFIVSNCIQTRIDNSYMVPNFRSTIDVYRTNTAPNTAFRSFGDIQGKLISENAIDDAAHSIGMEAHDVREKNLYKRGDTTPFGQALTYCYIREVWDYLKQISNFDKRKQAVAEYNAKNKWRKKGIYMLPVKYGSGYNLVMLEQATALVSIYSGDGTVIINQGGSDMGQGMVTKIEQVASYILNVPMDMIRINLPNTEVVPNPTSTGGSTGTAYNGLAVKQTCERIRDRLLSFGMDMLKQNGNAWCKSKGIDYWNYGDKGWAAEVTLPGQPTNLIWQNLIALAYSERIQLVETFNAKVPGGETAMPVLEYKTLEQAQAEAIPGIEVADFLIPGSFDSFCGFTYSAACTEVEVDILTGETKILRTDLMYDMGWSINPALDIGQVEGAFIQGVGYVMTEKLVFQPEGAEKGRLNTVNTWRYKPPGITNIPLEFNVHLFPRDKANGVPENPNELLSAKEVGEPPLVLSASVFFAIKAAVRASRLERGLSGLFKFDAPATVQEVRKACEVDWKET